MLLMFKTVMVILNMVSAAESVWNSHKNDPCDKYYCANGGTCVYHNYNEYKGNIQLTPTCQCTGSWQGERCDDNPCAGINCNSGTCYSSEGGSPLCCCAKGCTGENCADDDNSSCEAANGMCIVNDESCAVARTLDIPCCNDKVCCQVIASCEEANGVCISADVTCAADNVLDISSCDHDRVCCQTTEIVVCDGSSLNLSCDDGYYLIITAANYGRDDTTTCPHSDIQTDTCSEPTSLSVVQAACRYANSCSLAVNITTFGNDPCPGTHKYLRVSYYCVA